MSENYRNIAYCLCYVIVLLNILLADHSTHPARCIRSRQSALNLSPGVRTYCRGAFRNCCMVQGIISPSTSPISSDSLFLPSVFSSFSSPTLYLLAGTCPFPLYPDIGGLKERRKLPPCSGSGRRPAVKRTLVHSDLKFLTLMRYQLFLYFYILE